MTEKYQPGIITLMYHRVNLKDTDPWRICVSTHNFKEHIKVLKANFDVISLNDLTMQLTSGNIKINSICITFDDGYSDNVLHALPVLEKYNCPAAFFIATGFVNQPGFWWDELEIIFLHSKYLPHELSFEIMGKAEVFINDETELSSEQWRQHKQWRWYQKPPTSRCKIYLSIWEKLFVMNARAIKNTMDQIKNWAGHGEKNSAFRMPVNTQQLQYMSNNSLFTIAPHTHTHCNLSKKSYKLQHQEISRSKKYLHKNLGIESFYFSYPFGEYNNDTLEIVNNINLNCCFTTQAKTIFSGTNKNVLGRYQVFNWNGKTFEKQICKWLSSKSVEYHSIMQY